MCALLWAVIVPSQPKEGPRSHTYSSVTPESTDRSACQGWDGDRPGPACQGSDGVGFRPDGDLIGTDWDRMAPERIMSGPRLVRFRFGRRDPPLGVDKKSWFYF
jgi:hypothetical protein